MFHLSMFCRAWLRWRLIHCWVDVWFSWVCAWFVQVIPCNHDTKSAIVDRMLEILKQHVVRALRASSGPSSVSFSNSWSFEAARVLRASLQVVSQFLHGSNSKKNIFLIRIFVFSWMFSHGCFPDGVSHGVPYKVFFRDQWENFKIFGPYMTRRKHILQLFMQKFPLPSSCKLRPRRLGQLDLLTSSYKFTKC